MDWSPDDPEGPTAVIGAEAAAGMALVALGLVLTPGPVSYTHLTLPTTERV